MWWKTSTSDPISRWTTSNIKTKTIKFLSITLLKAKDKMLKAAREKWDTLHKRVQRQKCHLTSYQKKMKARKQRNSISEVFKENCQPRIFYHHSVSLSLKNAGPQKSHFQISKWENSPPASSPAWQEIKEFSTL